MKAMRKELVRLQAATEALPVLARPLDPEKAAALRAELLELARDRHDASESHSPLVDRARAIATEFGDDVGALAPREFLRTLDLADLDLLAALALAVEPSSA